MAKKIVRAHQKLADGSYDTLHYETEKAAIVDFEHTHDDRYYTEAEMNTKLNAKEPAFTKNNAFNKNFGTGGHCMPRQRQPPVQCAAGKQHHNEPVRHYFNNKLLVRRCKHAFEF